MKISNHKKTSFRRLALLLVEPQDKSLWRVVSRETTYRGISPNIYTPIAENLPNYPAARQVFEQQKGPKV